MLTSKKSLLARLEEVREELHQLSSLYNYEFQKEEILRKSEELDLLIVKIGVNNHHRGLGNDRLGGRSQVAKEQARSPA